MRSFGKLQISFVFAVVLMGETVAPVSAMPSADRGLQDRYDICVEKSVFTVDQRITACNDAIESNWYQLRALARLHFNRSTLLNAKGETAQGLDDLDAALKAWPKIVGDVADREVFYAERNNVHLALADLDHAAKLLPDSYPIFAVRATVDLIGNDVDDAAKDAAIALVARPDGVMALMARGNIEERRGDVAAALKDYEHVQSIEPHYATAYNASCYARALAKLDLQAHALPDCEKALTLKPGDEHALDSRGYVYLLLGRLDDAIADYNAVLVQNLQSPLSLYGRGLAKRQKGDTTANADIAAAEALLPGIDTKFGTEAIYSLKPALPD